VVWLVMAAACVPLAAGFLVAYPGRAGLAAPETPGTPVAPGVPDPAPRGLLASALRERGVLLGSAMLAVYVGLEISVGNWAFSYLVQARGLPATDAGYLVSGYWLGLTLGRFLISPVAARVGAGTVAMMYTCLAGVTATIVLAWVSPAGLLAGLVLMPLGFFLGPVFPTTIASAPRLTRPELVPTAIGVMNAASVGGGSALPWLAGLLAQGTGMWTLLPFSAALSLLQAAAWRPIARRIRLPEQQPCDLPERHNQVYRDAEIKCHRHSRQEQPDEDRDHVPENDGQKLSLFTRRLLALSRRRVEVLTPRILSQRRPSTRMARRVRP